MSSNSSPESGERGLSLGRIAGGVAGGAVTAIAAKFGAADFARDVFNQAIEVDYSDNIRDGGMALTAAAGTIYGAASLLSRKSRVANVIADRKSAAILVGGVGLAIWGTASAAGAIANNDGETAQVTPDSSLPPATVVTEAPTTSILDTAPENTVIVINTTGSGFFMPTPSGNPCELSFPYNDTKTRNTELLQAALVDLAAQTGDEALDPGPVDGDEGNLTYSAIQHWRTDYLGIPADQNMDLAQCDGMASLTDSDLSTPPGLGPRTPDNP